MEDLSGRQFGPYQVAAPLGEGGMAAVYKAYQPAMDRYVALKILPRHFARDPEFTARFQQEARLLARLQHPHILPVFDFGEADGYTYLVMPFIESGTLTDRLRASPLPLALVRRLFTQLGEALDYAHAHGLIHRDVKPSNVMLDARGNCLLTDFGLARMVESSSHLTSTGAVVGTPAYMSPEQGMGEALDNRTDIYSMGVILYEAATGRPPFNAETPMAVVIKHIHDPLPPPSARNPDLPEAVERVILKTLAKDRADRFATAGEFVLALQAAIPESASTTLPAVPAASAVEPAVPTLAAQAEPTAPAPQSPTEAPPVPRSDGERVGDAPRPVRKVVSAAPARPASLRSLLAITSLGWALSLLAGFALGSAAPFLGGLLGGAGGGFSLGLAWRRLQSGLPRRRLFALAGCWGLALGISALVPWLTLLLLPLACWLTGREMRQAEPRLSRLGGRAISLGWLLAWLTAATLVALGASLSSGPIASLLAAAGFLLLGLAGGWVTFASLQQARGEQAAGFPRRGWLALGLLCLAALVLALAGSARRGSAPAVPAGADQLLSVWDDFENPAFAGSYDPERWNLYTEDTPGMVYSLQQADGVLQVDLDGVQTTGGAFIQFSATGARPLSATNAIQARLTLDPNFRGEQFQLGLRIYRWPDPEGWSYTCWLRHGGERPVAACEVKLGSLFPYATEPVLIDAGRPYRLHMTIDPQTLNLSASLDQKLLDTYALEPAAAFRAAEYVFALIVWAEPGSAGRGTLDDFRLGAP